MSVWHGIYYMQCICLYWLLVCVCIFDARPLAPSCLLADFIFLPSTLHWIFRLFLFELGVSSSAAATAPRQHQTAANSLLLAELGRTLSHDSESLNTRINSTYFSCFVRRLGMRVRRAMWHAAALTIELATVVSEHLIFSSPAAATISNFGRAEIMHAFVGAKKLTLWHGPHSLD